MFIWWCDKARLVARRSSLRQPRVGILPVQVYMYKRHCLNQFSCNKTLHMFALEIYIENIKKLNVPFR